MSIWPLPLKPFERYMLADDRPAFPMTLVARLTFTGEADPNRLNAALHAAIRRHPLLHASISPLRLSRVRKGWHPLEKGLNIEWGSQHEPFVLSPPGIDLKSNSGLRIAVRVAAGCTDLWLQFHHACCDVLGLTQFLGDSLLAYAGVSLPSFSEATLAERGRCVMRRWKRFRTAPKGCKRVFDFYRRSPSPLRSRIPAPDLGCIPTTFPNFAAQTLKADELTRLRETAAQS